MIYGEELNSQKGLEKTEGEQAQEEADEWLLCWFTVKSISKDCDIFSKKDAQRTEQL